MNSAPFLEVYGQTGLVSEQCMELFSFYARFHCHSKGPLNEPVKKGEAHGEFYKNHPKSFITKRLSGRTVD